MQVDEFWFQFARCSVLSRVHHIFSPEGVQHPHQWNPLARGSFFTSQWNRMPKGHGRITLEGTLGVWSARRQPKEHLESEAPISLESWLVQDSKDGKRRESQLASGERHLRRVCGWRGGGPWFNARQEIYVDKCCSHRLFGPQPLEESCRKAPFWWATISLTKGSCAVFSFDLQGQTAMFAKWWIGLAATVNDLLLREAGFVPSFLRMDQTSHWAIFGASRE